MATGTVSAMSLVRRLTHVRPIVASRSRSSPKRGLEPLEGSREEVARLAEVMQQVSALASLNEDERVWLEDVVVGDAVVQLGINPHGQARVRILRP